MRNLTLTVAYRKRGKAVQRERQYKGKLAINNIITYNWQKK